MPGVGAVGDHRLQGGGVDGDGLLVDRAVVGGEGPPALDGGVEVGALRGVRPTGHVLEGRVVGGDEPGPRATLDGHVADGHALLHRQRPDALAGVLEDVAGAATHADAADEVEDDVLARDPGGQAAVDAHLVGPERALEEGLGGQHHLHLARADAECERAEGAVGGRVRVAADDGHARLREAQLRADDVDDALAVRAQRVERDAELRAVGGQLGELEAGLLVEDGQGAVVRRRGVVRRGHGPLGVADGQAAATEALEGLRAGDLVDEVEVDADDGRERRAPRGRRGRPRVFWTSVRGEAAPLAPRIGHAPSVAEGGRRSTMGRTWHSDAASGRSAAVKTRPRPFATRRWNRTP